MLYNLNTLLHAETDHDDDLSSPSMNDRDMRGSGHASGNGRATIHASSQIHQLEHGLLCSYNRSMLSFGGLADCFKLLDFLLVVAF